jgi:ribosome-binding protein aMBF1 (putative translation factor)
MQIQECLDELETRRTEKTNRASSGTSSTRNKPNSKVKGTTAKALLPAAELDGKTVKAARQAKGWTQAQLATTIGKSVSWVKLVESDRRRAVNEDQSLLRQVLGIQ